MREHMETAKMKIEAFETGYIQAVDDFARVLDASLVKFPKKTRQAIAETLGQEKFKSVARYAHEIMKEYVLLDESTDDEQ